MSNSKKNPAAVALGRCGGSVGSDAQKAAARENGKKGGRPKRRITMNCGCEWELATAWLCDQHAVAGDDTDDNPRTAVLMTAAEFCQRLASRTDN
jgi:hypothetical protein